MHGTWLPPLWTVELHHSLLLSFSRSVSDAEKVLRLYKSAQTTLWNLKTHGAMVLHGVDATSMDTLHILRERLFDRIVYNFPHAGFWGKESDKSVINQNPKDNCSVPELLVFVIMGRRHRRLVKMFFKNARTMLSRVGEIHVAHKEKYPYNKWKLAKQAQKCGLLLKESTDFHLADYPGYTNRRGDGVNIGGTFFLGNCRTYKFVLRPSFFELFHLLPIKPKWSWIAENDHEDTYCGLPEGLMGMPLKRRCVPYNEEQISCRPLKRQRLEDFDGLPELGFKGLPICGLNENINCGPPPATMRLEIPNTNFWKGHAFRHFHSSYSASFPMATATKRRRLGRHSPPNFSRTMNGSPYAFL
eukprot:Gb_13168 [translate_table: standard]